MIVSLLSGIIRNARNRRAAKKAQTEALNSLSDQQAQLDNIFNNEYYGDYMNRSDVQSMMRSMQDQMRQQNAQNYNMAAVTGATPEALAAQQNNNAAIDGKQYLQPDRSESVELEKQCSQQLHQQLHGLEQPEV